MKRLIVISTTAAIVLASALPGAAAECWVSGRRGTTNSNGGCDVPAQGGKASELPPPEVLNPHPGQNGGGGDERGSGR